MRPFLAILLLLSVFAVIACFNPRHDSPNQFPNAGGTTQPAASGDLFGVPA